MIPRAIINSQVGYQPNLWEVTLAKPTPIKWSKQAAEQVSAKVSIVQLAGPWQGVGAVTRNAVVVSPGRLDRSATGTGLSARMATLHARGLMRVGDTMTDNEHADPRHQEPN